ncbi:MAG: hypothetical protein CMO55_10720 [Verrucomicrobiales bacterium]|nr:hypothetical protein [Verrucomicrobiales bacterium]
MKHLATFLSVAALCAWLNGITSLHAAEVRDWTNNAGVTIRAEALSFTEDSVVLKLENGREYTVALNTLSDADVEYANKTREEMAAIANAPELKTEPIMATPGKILYSSPLTQIDSDWRTAVGSWSASEAGVSGTEVAADDHAAVMKRAMPLKDVIIEFDVLLGSGKSASFGLDDAKDHVCRVTITPTSFQAKKDDNDHEGPDVGKPFNSIQEELETDEWHTVRMEILGETLLAQTGDHISLGSDPLLATEKAKWGFIVSGETIGFRDLNIWEALPSEDGEKEVARLKRRLDIED